MINLRHFHFKMLQVFVHSSFAIIMMGKRELAALLSLSSWCLAVVLGNGGNDIYSRGTGNKVHILSGTGYKGNIWGHET